MKPIKYILMLMAALFAASCESDPEPGYVDPDWVDEQLTEIAEGFSGTLNEYEKRLVGQYLLVGEGYREVLTIYDNHTAKIKQVGTEAPTEQLTYKWKADAGKLVLRYASKEMVEYEYSIDGPFLLINGNRFVNTDITSFQTPTDVVGAATLLAQWKGSVPAYYEQVWGLGEAVAARYVSVWQFSATAPDATYGIGGEIDYDPEQAETEYWYCPFMWQKDEEAHSILITYLDTEANYGSVRIDDYELSETTLTGTLSFAYREETKTETKMTVTTAPLSLSRITGFDWTPYLN
ncbi:MAG: hypothetical protein IJ710_01865 [Prevotella sp.]|nr:hypothetical protein [Prevotella sp.]